MGFSNATLHSIRTPAAGSVILTAIASDDSTYVLFFKYLVGYSISARSLPTAVARQARQYPPCYLTRVMPGMARLIVSGGY
jgi:hypothetical protein